MRRKPAEADNSRPSRVCQRAHALIMCKYYLRPCRRLHGPSQIRFGFVEIKNWPVRDYFYTRKRGQARAHYNLNQTWFIFIQLYVWGELILYKNTLVVGSFWCRYLRKILIIIPGRDVLLNRRKKILERTENKQPVQVFTRKHNGVRIWYNLTEMIQI